MNLLFLLSIYDQRMIVIRIEGTVGRGIVARHWREPLPLPAFVPFCLAAAVACACEVAPADGVGNGVFAQTTPSSCGPCTIHGQQGSHVVRDQRRRHPAICFQNVKANRYALTLIPTLSLDTPGHFPFVLRKGPPCGQVAALLSTDFAEGCSGDNPSLRTTVEERPFMAA